MINLGTNGFGSMPFLILYIKRALHKRPFLKTNILKKEEEEEENHCMQSLADTIKKQFIVLKYTDN